MKNKLILMINSVKKRILYRYIFSYLLIFMIPFVILSISWYSATLNGMKNQLNSANRNKIVLVQKTFSSELKQLEYLTKQISLNEKISSNRKSDVNYNDSIREELINYKLNNDFIEEIYVSFFNQNDLIFSSSEVYSFNELALIKFSELQKKNLKNDLSSTASVLRKYNQQTGNLDELKKTLEYIVPQQSKNGEIFGTVMYTLKNKSIQELLEGLLDNNDGDAFIIDAKGQILSASNKNQNILQSKASNFPIELLKNSTLKFNNKDYSIRSIKEPYFSYRFVTLTYPKDAFKGVNRVQFNFFIAVTLIFVVGLVTTFLISYRQYKPIQIIKKVLDESHADFNNKKEFGKHDELASITQSLSTYLDQNQELKREIKRQTPYAREQVLRKLLGGQLSQMTELSLLLESVNVNFTSDAYFVVLIQTKMVNNDMTILNQEFLMSILGQVDANYFQAYGTELISSPTIALVVGYESQTADPQEDQYLVVEELLNYIEKENSYRPVTCIGSSYSDLAHLNRSYIESLAALDYQALYETEDTIYFSEINDEGLMVQSQFSYPTEDELKLVQSIIQGDSIVAKETLLSMFNFAERRQVSLQEITLYRFYLINLLLKASLEAGYQVGSNKLEELVSEDSFRDLQHKLLAFVGDICEFVSRKEQSRDSQLKSDIFDYLDQNYASHDLSLDSVAQKFGFSISYLSRFIKEATGITFTKYIQELRLEKIQKALIETDDPIKDIIGDSGYYDVSNFTRKFKTIVGVTPGQYRKLNR